MIGKKSGTFTVDGTKMLKKRIAISKTKKMRFMIEQIRYNVNKYVE